MSTDSTSGHKKRGMPTKPLHGLENPDYLRLAFRDLTISVAALLFSGSSFEAIPWLRRPPVEQARRDRSDPDLLFTLLSTLLNRPRDADVVEPDFLEALRNEAGVMFGESFSPEPDCVGVLGRSGECDLRLPLSTDFTCRDAPREDCLTDFKAPTLGILCGKLTVVMRVDRIVGSAFRRCARLALAVGMDRFRARFWRDAI
jgi:hypothetical protein